MKSGSVTQTIPATSRRAPSDFIRNLPKAELHLHLEGAIAPETLIELARNHGQTLTSEDLPRFYHYTDFTGFLLCFRRITKFLETPEDYELAAYRLMERLAAQNVKHAEIFIAVGACLWWGHRFEDIFVGLERGRVGGERDFGISVYWLFDAVRHLGPEAAQCVAEHAVRQQDCGSVVGFGIGGDERRAAPELFRKVYQYSASHGLRLTCHAGEIVGPHSVWGALRALSAERIGHGTSCWQDTALLAHLLETQVPVEISLTSNLRTGAISALARHPLKTYFDLGLLVTLNTDDPEMFGTSLAGEYQLAQDVFGFTDAQLARMARNSFQASFLPVEKKREYLRLFAE